MVDDDEDESSNEPEQARPSKKAKASNETDDANVNCKKYNAPLKKRREALAGWNEFLFLKVIKNKIIDIEFSISVIFDITLDIVPQLTPHVLPSPLKQTLKDYQVLTTIELKSCRFEVDFNNGGLNSTAQKFRRTIFGVQYLIHFSCFKKKNFYLLA
ncbi:hypothetical protein BpHYR1_048080 [Brachionus plicatilis]|uniref:Uncharacterized protein n=1 Tax=Brachionus plicatilis TaxID=10195 RepID=A0A3M7PX42_BRAPC|nr:hypothetical protein BpHYR1_048080 [Brachionus plicatilis]